MRPAGSFDAQGLFKQLAPWSAPMLLSNDLAGIKLAVVESAVCKAPTTPTTLAVLLVQATGTC